MPSLMSLIIIYLCYHLYHIVLSPEVLRGITVVFFVDYSHSQSMFSRAFAIRILCDLSEAVALQSIWGFASAISFRDISNLRPSLILMFQLTGF